MANKRDVNAFLAKLSSGADLEEPPKTRAAAPEPAVPQQPATETHVLPPPVPARTRKAVAKTKPRRAELKHFGGYLNDETLEKIALLRIRLKKDNSELITFAIEELYRKHNAKRAFGDG